MDSRNYHGGRDYILENYRKDSGHRDISSYSSNYDYQYNNGLDIIIAVSVVLAVLTAICIYCTCLRTRRAEGIVYSVMSQPPMDGVIGTESSRNHATV